MTTALIDAKLMCIVAALRHGIQTLNSPGLSINTHPNPFFMHVIGELDLKHIAERVVQNLMQFEASEKKRLEADAATAASAVDGH
jgi:hypothetical protein